MKTASAAPAEAPRTVDMFPLEIRAAVGSIDDADRSVEVTWTTGAAVERMDWMTGKRYLEVLSLDPAHVMLDRLNQGGPLLDSHSAYSVSHMLGAVVPGSVSLSKKEGRARVRFSRRQEVEGVWQDVRDGLVRHLSVGYRVYTYEETEGKGNKLPVRTATRWEPHELSMVPIPADAGAKVRAGEKVETYPCEIVRADVRADEKEQPVTQQTRSEFIAEQPAIAPAPAPAPVPEPNERDLGATQERERVQGILTACRAARLPQSFADKLITDGVRLVDAQSRVFAELNARAVDHGGPSAIPRDRPEVVVGDDPLVHARAGIENAMLHRIDGARFKLEEVGRQYRGMSLLGIGSAYLSARGVRVTSMDRSALVDAMLGRAGMHTGSDFPSLLEDVARKNLRAAYEAAPQTWREFARPVSLSDFKPARQVQIGDAPGLDEILDHGEFGYGTIAEAKEAVQLKTYGKVFAITRQALINDDLNAFGTIPAAFGRKASDKESDLAWAQITGNPTMGDNVVLFSVATHANLTTGPGTVISVASLGVGRAAIRKQKGLDGVTPLNLSPRFLMVPTSLETLADQFVTQITPAQSSQANPFGPGGRTPLQVIVESRLDDDSVQKWYMATSADQAPLLYYGTLDGQAGPDVRQMEGFDIDGIKFRCRIDVAFKAADWRAAYRNDGA